MDQITEFLNSKRYTPSDLVTIATAKEAIKMAIDENSRLDTQVMQKIANTQEALHILGEVWRGDWSDFDGRTLRDQLNEICQILDGARTVKEFMRNNGIIEDEKYKGIYKWEY